MLTPLDCEELPEKIKKEMKNSLKIINDARMVGRAIKKIWGALLIIGSFLPGAYMPGAYMPGAFMPGAFLLVLVSLFVVTPFHDILVSWLPAKFSFGSQFWLG